MIDYGIYMLVNVYMYMYIYRHTHSSKYLTDNKIRRKKPNKKQTKKTKTQNLLLKQYNPVDIC